jgi:hypothetical protein
MPEKKKPRFTFDRPQYMTSGAFDRDPKPMEGCTTGKRYSLPFSSTDAGEMAYERPRPEFNFHDPIVKSFRQMHGGRDPAALSRAASAYLASVDSMVSAMGLSTMARKHAVRVLSLLATTYEEN